LNVSSLGTKGKIRSKRDEKEYKKEERLRNRREAPNTRNKGRRRTNKRSKQRNTYVINKHLRGRSNDGWPSVPIEP
jgi:hypothetical protein